MKAVELYCGAGGMTLGFVGAGFDVVLAIDSDPVQLRAHRTNLPQVPCLQADLRSTTGRSILRESTLRAGEAAVVFGGPPCAGFSEIGHRRQDDHRNELVLRFAEIVCEVRPRYFVMENVRGLLFSRHQRTLRHFRAVLDAGGYALLEPVRVLDAADYGVPQRRHRVFFLGYRKGELSPSYPEPLGRPPTVWEAIGDLPRVDDFTELLETDIYEGSLGVPSAYAASLRFGRAPAVGLTGCGRTKHSAAVRRRFAAARGGKPEPKSRCYRLASDDISFTLRAGTGPEGGSFTAARPIHPTQPRCITVREAARLHSFPDWFEFDEAKWHALRQIGNSVPPLLAKAVAHATAMACRGESEELKRSA